MNTKQAAKHKFTVGQKVETKGARVFTARFGNSAYLWNEGTVEELGWSKPVKQLDLSQPVAEARPGCGWAEPVYKLVSYPMVKVNGKWFSQKDVIKKAK